MGRQFLLRASSVDCRERVPIRGNGHRTRGPAARIAALPYSLPVPKCQSRRCSHYGKKGAIAFVDDYTRWTVGMSAEANTDTLQRKVIPRAFE